MAWTFRKRKKILPGVHMNYGSSGVSFNIGVPGASITVGSKGVYANMGVPGTGIRNRKKIDAISEKTTDSDNNAPQITEQEFKTYVRFKKTLYIVSFIASYIFILIGIVSLNTNIYVGGIITLLVIINTIRLHLHYRRFKKESKRFYSEFEKKVEIQSQGKVQQFIDYTKADFLYFSQESVIKELEKFYPTELISICKHIINTKECVLVNIQRTLHLSCNKVSEVIKILEKSYIIKPDGNNYKVLANDETIAIRLLIRYAKEHNLG